MSDRKKICPATGQIVELNRSTEMQFRFKDLFIENICEYAFRVSVVMRFVQYVCLWSSVGTRDPWEVHDYSLLWHEKAPVTLKMLHYSIIIVKSCILNKNILATFACGSLAIQ